MLIGNYFISTGKYTYAEGKLHIIYVLFSDSDHKYRHFYSYTCCIHLAYRTYMCNFCFLQMCL